MKNEIQGNCNFKCLFALFLGLEVLFNDILGLRFLAIILDDNTTATNNLAGLALSVNLAETHPLTKLLVVINLSVRAVCVLATRGCKRI